MYYLRQSFNLFPIYFDVLNKNKVMFVPNNVFNYYKTGFE